MPRRRPRRHRLHRGLQGLRGAARAAEARRGRARGDDASTPRGSWPRMTFEALSRHPVFVDQFALGDDERHPAHQPGRRRRPAAGGARHRQHPRQVRARHRRRRAQHAVPATTRARAGGARHERQHVRAPGGAWRTWTSCARRGVGVVEPGSGYLACGWLGKGRLAEVPEIVEAAHGASWRAGATSTGETVAGHRRARRSRTSTPCASCRTAPAGAWATGWPRRRATAARAWCWSPGPPRWPRPRAWSSCACARRRRWRARSHEHAREADDRGHGGRGVRLPAGHASRPTKIKKADGRRRASSWCARPTSCARWARPRAAGSWSASRPRRSSVLENARAQARRRRTLDLHRGQRRVGTDGAGFAADDNAAVLIDDAGGDARCRSMSKRELAERIWDRVVELREPRRPCARRGGQALSARRCERAAGATSASGRRILRARSTDAGRRRATLRRRPRAASAARAGAAAAVGLDAVPPPSPATRRVDRPRRRSATSSATASAASSPAARKTIVFGQGNPNARADVRGRGAGRRRGRAGPRLRRARRASS